MGKTIKFNIINIFLLLLSSAIAYYVITIDFKKYYYIVILDLGLLIFFYKINLNSMRQYIIRELKSLLEEQNISYSNKDKVKRSFFRENNYPLEYNVYMDTDYNDGTNKYDTTNKKYHIEEYNMDVIKYSSEDVGIKARIFTYTCKAKVTTKKRTRSSSKSGTRTTTRTLHNDKVTFWEVEFVAVDAENTYIARSKKYLSAEYIPGLQDYEKVGDYYAINKSSAMHDNLVELYSEIPKADFISFQDNKVVIRYSKRIFKKRFWLYMSVAKMNKILSEYKKDVYKYITIVNMVTRHIK